MSAASRVFAGREESTSPMKLSNPLLASPAPARGAVELRHQRTAGGGGCLDAAPDSSKYAALSSSAG
ncbi:hypothetical protein RKD19_000473 [Streptomyces canus]